MIVHTTDYTPNVWNKYILNIVIRNGERGNTECAHVVMITNYHDTRELLYRTFTKIGLLKFGIHGETKSCLQ